MNTSHLVMTETRDHVLTITLNHPKANALNRAMISDLQATLRQAEQASEVRCVLLLGSGKFFSSGHDLNEVRQVLGEPIRPYLVRYHNPLILQIRRLEKPVMAAINGMAAGAGLGIALACDLRIAAQNAYFVVGFLGVGLGVDSGVSLLLPTLMGLGRASEYTFTNAAISAEQALAWGLVNRLASEEELHQKAHEWAAEIAQGAVGAMGLAKRAFNKAMLPSLEEALDYEAYLQDVAASRQEHQEGLRAFFEKRMPRFI